MIIVRESVRGFYDDQGGMIYFDGAVEDISIRKQAEQALQESEERFRSLYENLPIGLYRAKGKGYVELANPALLKLLGYERDCKEFREHLKYAGFSNKAEHEAFYEKLHREGVVSGKESIWKKRDGSLIFVRESAAGHI